VAGKILGAIAFDDAEFAPQIAKGVQFLGIGADSVVIRAALKHLAGTAP